MSILQIGILSYLVYIVLFGIFSYFALYHLWRFGFTGDATKKMIIAYLIAVLAIILATFILLLI